MDLKTGQKVYVAVPYNNEDNILLYQIQETALTYVNPVQAMADGGISGYSIRLKYTDANMNRRRRYNCFIFSEDETTPYADDFERKRCKWTSNNQTEYGLLFFDDDRQRLVNHIKSLFDKQIEHARSAVNKMIETLDKLETQLKCDIDLEPSL